MRKWRFELAKLTDKLWLRATLYAVLGVAVALLAGVFSSWVPESLAKPFGGGTVNGLLNVLASSLLAVATFSVAAMLTAFSNVSSGATPRAATLVAGNRQALGAVATFIGTFLYAVVGYSAVGTGYYGQGGRAILFLVTLAMLVLVAITLLRWLDQLLHLARVDNVIAAVEAETLTALEGFFGGRPSDEGPECPASGTLRITAGLVGYVQNVDLEALVTLAAEKDLRIWIKALPGALTMPGTVLAVACGALGPDVSASLREPFTLSVDRSFAQDPQFGFIVLGEIASHALSAAMNNHGVAKDVLTACARLLDRWMALRRTPAPDDKKVYWCNPTLRDVLEDALLPISIDGATTLSVACRLLNVLAALRCNASEPDRAILDDFAHEALERSLNGTQHEPDRLRLRRAAGLAPIGAEVDR